MTSGCLHSDANVRNLNSGTCGVAGEVIRISTAERLVCNAALPFGICGCSEHLLAAASPM